MLFDSKLKVYIGVLITTVVSVILSVMFTGIIRGGLNEPSTLIPSIVVPLCVAPLASLWGFTQAHKIAVLNKQLANLLNHDPLTNAHSRSYFFDVAYNDPPYGSAVTLMIDADRFKQINDTYGHDVGDEALRHLSEQISLNCRKSDVVARLGGEEFGVYMPDTNINTAQIVAERIRTEISRNPMVVGEFSIPLSVSIGIASRRPGEQIKDVLKRADDALYRAKNNGRNQVRVETEYLPELENAPAV